MLKTVFLKAVTETWHWRDSSRSAFLTVVANLHTHVYSTVRFKLYRTM